MALSLSGLLILSACSSEDELSIPDNQGKTPIELSVGTSEVLSAITRSGETTAPNVTNNNAGKATAFEAGTSLYMVMKSENATDNTAAPMFSRTIGYAPGYTSTSDKSTKVSFSSLYGRFWEDSYSRNSQLSVFAACVPGHYLPASVHEELTATGNIDNTIWSMGDLATPWSNDELTTYDNRWLATYGYTSIAWPLRGQSVSQQDVAFVSAQDLCFSNNISSLSTEDKRVSFDATSKRFGSGQLVFWHALSRVTFQIKKGKGFEKDEKFEFSETGKNIVLKKFFSNGTFNIEQGRFTDSTAVDINALAITATNTSGFDYILDGLMLPGTDLNDTEEGTISFTINNNLYLLKKEVLLTALKGQGLTADNKMRPGVHYIFTMTVGKKQMDSFTASVVDREQVDADEVEPSNARITLELLDNGVKKTGAADFDLFRTENVSSEIDDDYESFSWDNGYSLDANKAYLTGTSGTYAANESVTNAENGHDAWYWPDNKTFYHFRTVMPQTTSEWKVMSSSSDNKDYITLAAGFNGSYRDVCWGAPFKDTKNKLTYDYTSNGFDGTGSGHQLNKAIGPTEGNISLILFHMMSDVTIRLTTTEGTDKVDLANAKMELSNMHAVGKVLMGNGLVVTTDDAHTIDNKVSETENQTPWHYGFIPQSLEGVELIITTQDNNQYIVTMKNVVAATVGNNVIENPYTKNANGKYVIDRWLPNYQYTYTFKLTKAGITKMTATLANWEKVEAGDDNVQIQ